MLNPTGSEGRGKKTKKHVVIWMLLRWWPKIMFGYFWHCEVKDWWSMKWETKKAVGSLSVRVHYLPMMVVSVSIFLSVPWKCDNLVNSLRQDHEWFSHTCRMIIHCSITYKSHQWIFILLLSNIKWKFFSERLQFRFLCAWIRTYVSPMLCIVWGWPINH